MDELMRAWPWTTYVLVFLLACVLMLWIGGRMRDVSSVVSGSGHKDVRRGGLVARVLLVVLALSVLSALIMTWYGLIWLG